MKHFLIGLLSVLMLGGCNLFAMTKPKPMELVGPEIEDLDALEIKQDPTGKKSTIQEWLLSYAQQNRPEYLIAWVLANVRSAAEYKELLDLELKLATYIAQRVRFTGPEDSYAFDYPEQTIITQSDDPTLIQWLYVLQDMQNKVQRVQTKDSPVLVEAFVVISKFLADLGVSTELEKVYDVEAKQFKNIYEAKRVMATNLATLFQYYFKLKYTKPAVQPELVDILATGAWLQEGSQF